MRDKIKTIIIVILSLVIISLVSYIVYNKILDNKEEIIEVNHYSLEEVLNKIYGYWRVPSDNSLIVMSFLENGEYSSFYYASEGGTGGIVKKLEYNSSLDEYTLLVDLNPRLLCSEEYCEEGATIGEYSEPETIKLNIKLDKISDKILIVDNVELKYLGSTYKEMEENIFKQL